MQIGFADSPRSTVGDRVGDRDRRPGDGRARVGRRSRARRPPRPRRFAARTHHPRAPHQHGRARERRARAGRRRRRGSPRPARRGAQRPPRIGDYDLICSGSHPFSQWYDQQLTDKPRYHKLIDRTRWWGGRNMMIWGIHVHVGLDDRAKRCRSSTGSSPTSRTSRRSAHRARSGRASRRGTRRTARSCSSSCRRPDSPPIRSPTGPPTSGTSTTSCGRASSRTTARSGGTSAPPRRDGGTIEVRVCDGVSTAAEIAAIAALIQCLVEWMSERLDRGETLQRSSLVRSREQVACGALRHGREIITDVAGGRSGSSATISSTCS